MTRRSILKALATLPVLLGMSPAKPKPHGKWVVYLHSPSCVTWDFFRGNRMAGAMGMNLTNPPGKEIWAYKLRNNGGFHYVASLDEAWEWVEWNA